MKRGRDVARLIAQAIEFFLAVHARDFIEILFDLGTRPALGCSAARAGWLQVFEQRTGARGEMQALHERVVALNGALAFEQPEGNPGQLHPLVVLVGQEQRAVAGQAAFQRRAMADNGTWVVTAEDTVQVAPDNVLGRVFEVRGVELGRDAAQPAGFDVPGNGGRDSRFGAAEDDFFLRDRPLSFFH